VAPDFVVARLAGRLQILKLFDEAAGCSIERTNG